jgi:plastocyanin
MRMASVIAAVMAGWIAIAACPAAELRVRVDDARGKPVSDAVVRVLPGDAAVAAERIAPAPARTLVVDQRDEQFIPYVAVFRPGDRVVFRNSDTTRHHVYSFSPAKTFEMVVSPGESAAPLLLDRAGIVAVGCNIHDHMRTWLFVSDTPRIAVTGADGAAQFSGLAAGRYRVVAWHPQLRPRQPEVASDFALATGTSSGNLQIRLSLLPDPRKQMDGMSY